MNVVLFDYNGTTALKANWLWGDGEIISKNSYNVSVNRKKITVLKRGCRNTPAIISYKSLPYSLKAKVDAKLQQMGELSGGGACAASSPEEPPKPCYFEAYIKPDPEAMAYFSARFEGDFKRINRYYTNAIVLNGLKSLMQDRIADRKGRRKTGRLADGLMPSLIADLKSLSEVTVNGTPKYPHKLPLSVRNLRQIIAAYTPDAGGYESLVHANDGNAHAKVVSKSIEALFLSIYCMENKPYASWVWEDYIDFTEFRKEIYDYHTGEVLSPSDYLNPDGEVVQVSESTVWNYINKPSNRLIVDSVRSHPHRFRHHHAPHFTRKPPRYSLSMVSMDDHDLPRPLRGGGHVYAYYAFDVMSGMIVGYAHSRQKREPLFLDCLRNMYHNLNEWGLGMPLEVQVENHLCGKFKDTFLNDGSLFASVTFCSPTNSQEKHAEDFIEIKKYCADKRLQQNVGRHYAKLEANRVEGVRIYNEETNEYEFKYKEYTYEQIVAEDIQSIKYYNNMKHRHKAMYPNVSIRDAFFANINPKVGTMDNHRVSYWLGQPVNTSIDRHQYVNLQYQKYWLEDLHLIERLAPGNYNVIAYFMRDRNGVPYPEAYIYQNNKYIGRVCTFEKVQTAKAEWEDADTEAKRAQKDYMERFGKYIQEGKGELMPLRYSNINRTVNQLNEDRQAYIVAPAQVEEAESEPRYDFDEQSALEYAREQALTF